MHLKTQAMFRIFDQHGVDLALSGWAGPYGTGPHIGEVAIWIEHHIAAERQRKVALAAQVSIVPCKRDAGVRGGTVRATSDGVRSSSERHESSLVTVKAGVESYREGQDGSGDERDRCSAQKGL